MCIFWYDFCFYRYNLPFFKMKVGQIKYKAKEWSWAIPAFLSFLSPWALADRSCCGMFQFSEKYWECLLFALQIHTNHNLKNQRKYRKNRPGFLTRFTWITGFFPMHCVKLLAEPFQFSSAEPVDYLWVRTNRKCWINLLDRFQKPCPHGFEAGHLFPSFIERGFQNGQDEKSAQGPGPHFMGYPDSLCDVPDYFNPSRLGNPCVTSQGPQESTPREKNPPEDDAAPHPVCGESGPDSG